ncbi:MAG: DUF2252 family protein [Phyllobacterium sp.]|uniref:DUF2252 family protein n=1 Tax=Phyllobacterium sp. TaxID=1871046 RepID=UPI0030F0F080
MSLVDDVLEYGKWLRQQCAVVEAGLRKKHNRMARDAFMFFRATCFRFARKVKDVVPELGDATEVPSVGDAHIENWGTWRDAEGRLVWGVNDFDEAARLPYTYDLLRLATSARLAPGLPGTNRERVAAIQEGYRRGLDAPGPWLVDDETPWMQALVNRPAAKAGAFGRELASLRPEQPPAAVSEALCGQLPAGTAGIEFGAWQRGGGSLGRPRYVATGTWKGGRVVREAKALVPSAWEWASESIRHDKLFLAMAKSRYRAPDPFLAVGSGFVIRRLAPDSAKIDLSTGEAHAYGPELLRAMGAELASIHLANDIDVDAIHRDMDKRGREWLFLAAKAAENAVQTDFQKWRAYHKSQ